MSISKSKITLSVFSFLLALGLSLSLQSLLAAWAPPTAAPPFDNAPAPITVGTSGSAQIINGGLGVMENFLVGTNAFFVNQSTGRVGIGTTNPLYPLDVNGVIKTVNRVEYENGGADWQVGLATDGNRGFTFLANHLVSNKEKLRITDSGNVGIGTTNPGAKLVSNVNGSGSVTGLIVNNQFGYGGGVGTASTRISFGRDPGTTQTIISGAIESGNQYETTSNDGFMAFLTKSGESPYPLSERMRIDSSGNVGIGMEPAEKLHVNGLIRIPFANSNDNNSPGITSFSDDDFLYDGEYLNHYGIGWHEYTSPQQTGINAYLSGYYGINLFTGGANRLRIASRRQSRNWDD